MDCPPENVTSLLNAASSGSEEAWKQLFSVVYKELHQLARTVMKLERRDRVLQTTALIHEAYLRLLPGSDVQWQGRSHFFCVAAKAMRRILVDEARRVNATKRKHRIEGDPDKEVVAGQACRGGGDSDALYDDLEALDRALENLKSQTNHKRKCAIVELHFFAGLSFDEVSRILDVSPGTVYRDWRFTKAWLSRELERTAGHGV